MRGSGRCTRFIECPQYFIGGVRPRGSSHLLRPLNEFEAIGHDERVLELLEAIAAEAA
jgi:hypothetical protein